MPNVSLGYGVPWEQSIIVVYNEPKCMSCVSYPMMNIVTEGKSPFWIACYFGHIDVLEWMLSHGVPSSEITRASMCSINEDYAMMNDKNHERMVLCVLSSSIR